MLRQAATVHTDSYQAMSQRDTIAKPSQTCLCVHFIVYTEFSEYKHKRTSKVLSNGVSHAKNVKQPNGMWKKSQISVQWIGFCAILFRVSIGMAVYTPVLELGNSTKHFVLESGIF